MDIEAEKIAIEREKLGLERMKAELEVSKTRWTAVSVAIPVVVALLTIAYGFWSSNNTALLQFQLEAAKSAMQASNRVQANNRLIYYKKLFPSFLPDSFSPVKTEQSSGLDVITEKKELYRVLTSTKDVTAVRALNIWNSLFDYEWARSNELRGAVSAVDESNPQLAPSSGSSGTSSQTPSIQRDAR